MSTVPVMIHIEEAEFIPVLRKIDGILGVAGIDLSRTYRSFNATSLRWCPRNDSNVCPRFFRPMLCH
jgi:hypothetical protein